VRWQVEIATRAPWRVLAWTTIAAWVVSGGIATGVGVRQAVNLSSVAGPLGTPLPWAGEVDAVSHLLQDAVTTSELPWLVLYPEGTHPFALQYIRYQLAHLLYPVRIDVFSSDGLSVRDSQGIVTAPGVRLPLPAAGERDGFTLHVLSPS
jgi:hypothetical protein